MNYKDLRIAEEGILDRFRSHGYGASSNKLSNSEIYERCKKIPSELQAEKSRRKKELVMIDKLISNSIHGLTGLDITVYEKFDSYYQMTNTEHNSTYLIGKASYEFSFIFYDTPSNLQKWKVLKTKLISATRNTEIVEPFSNIYCDDGDEFEPEEELYRVAFYIDVHPSAAFMDAFHNAQN